MTVANPVRAFVRVLLALLLAACAANPAAMDITERLKEADEPAPPCATPAISPGTGRPAGRPAAAVDLTAKSATVPSAPKPAARSDLARESRALGTGAGAVRQPNPSAFAVPQRPAGPVTAGLVDDNDRWAEYLGYRKRVGGFVVRERDVEQRIVVEVRDDRGRPVHDAVVEGGGARLRTDSAGRALFHPYAEGRRQDSRWTLTARKQGASGSAVAELGQPNNLRIMLPVARLSHATRLDLLFLIDTTGSMADEIERLRSTMDVIVKDIARSTADPRSVPDIRYGLVHYRDRGDEYVVRSHDFTPSLRAFRQDLACLRAAGGGDYAESLNAGLNAAVHRMAWRNEDAVRMVILIADAPPHLDYRDETFDYAQDMTFAAAKGIKVFPIGASGLDAQGEYVFRQMAQFTGGKFVFLTYADRNRPGAAPGVETSHDVKDYSVDNLDRLVVRLVTEELRPLRD